MNPTIPETSFLKSEWNKLAKFWSASLETQIWNDPKTAGWTINHKGITISPLKQVMFCCHVSLPVGSLGNLTIHNHNFENSLPQSQFESLSRLAPWETHPKTNNSSLQLWNLTRFWLIWGATTWPFSHITTVFFCEGYHTCWLMAK